MISDRDGVLTRSTSVPKAFVPPLCLLFTLLGGCRIVAGYGSSDLLETEFVGAPDARADGKGNRADGGGSADAVADQEITGDEPDATEMPEASNEPEPDANDGRAEASNDAQADVTFETSDGPSKDAEPPPPDVAEAGPIVIVDGPCDPVVLPDGSANLVTNPGFELEAADAETGADAEAGSGASIDPGAGWYAVNNGGTFEISSTTGHCSGHSGLVTGRSQQYHGPGYTLALPEGTYQVSVWVMQNGAASLTIGVQGVATSCTPQYLNVAFQMVYPNTWTNLTGALTVPAGCTSQNFQIVQTDNPKTGPIYPDIYADELYVWK